jgi:hypothetical protein
MRARFPARIFLLCASFLLATLPTAAAVGPFSPSGHPIIYVGVVYFSPTGNINDDAVQLQSIIDTFGGAYRTGTAYDVQLVIQSEIPWKAVEPNGPTSSTDPAYSYYQQFAQLISSKNLVWTPLISYHYVPDWVSQAHGHCEYTTTEPRTLIGCTDEAMPGFMPFIPTSSVWTVEAYNWTQDVVQALAPYLNSPIKAILCGNEMLGAKRPSWAQSPGDPTSLTAAEFDTRSANWANAITSVINAAKSVAQGRVPVSTKLVPYALRAREILTTSMFPHVYDLLDSLDLVAIDPYPPSEAEYQALFRSDKATFLAEFNGQVGGATGDEVLSWIKTGVSRFNLRYATFFAWNGDDARFVMTTDEKSGLNRAISWILTQPAVHNQPSRSVSFQLSTYILKKSDPNAGWWVPEEEARRHESAFLLGSRLPFPIRYEVDYRPRTANVPISQIVSSRNVSSFSTPAIYLLEDPASVVTAGASSFYTSGNSGNSDSKVAYPSIPNLPAGVQVFDWTPQWAIGNVRRLEKQPTTLATQNWLVAPDGPPVAQQSGNSFFIAHGTLFELAYHPERQLPTVIGKMIDVGTGRTGCGETSCVAPQGAYISHFTGPGCTGNESYYLPYNGGAYACRTWNGTGQCGTIRRTVTNRSYKLNGVCTDAWQSGNTLEDFVAVYR